MKKICLISISLLMVLYFIVKLFCLNYYDIKKSSSYKYIKDLKISEDISIKNIDSDDYYTFNDIRIRNDFKNYTYLKNNTKDKSFRQFRVNDKSYILMGSSESYYDILKNSINVYGSNISKINKSGLIKFLNKNNIHDDIDLFKYVIMNKNKRNNIFTSIREMRDNYSVYELLEVMLPKTNSISIINGNCTGYILDMGKIKEVSILKNNKKYIFTFINTDYFSDSDIKDLISTITIK